MDKEVTAGKITRVLSVDVLAFTSDFQPQEEGTPHKFLFMMLAPLREGKFEAEAVYPLGWYSSIIRPIGLEKNEGAWYTVAYSIPYDE